MSITPNRLPWLIDINVFMTPVSHVNWNTNVTSTDLIRNGSRDSTGAQNAEISFDLVLAKGTWTVEIMHTKGTDAGTYSVQIDSVEKGTVDGYNASTTYNNLSTVTSIAVTATGKRRLTLKMATKNASSSSYYGRIQHIQLRRTA